MIFPACIVGSKRIIYALFLNQNEMGWRQALCLKVGAVSEIVAECAARTFWFVNDFSGQ